MRRVLRVARDATPLARDATPLARDLIRFGIERKDATPFVAADIRLSLMILPVIFALEPRLTRLAKTLREWIIINLQLGDVIILQNTDVALDTLRDYFM